MAISLAEIVANCPLYSVMKLDDTDAKIIASWLFQKHTFDCFCVRCKMDSIFESYLGGVVMGAAHNDTYA